MVTLSACIGVALVTTQTAAFATFLSRRGPADLPAAYLTTAIGAAALGYGYLHVASRVAFPTLLRANLSGLFVVSVGVRLALSDRGASWMVFALPAWFQVLTNLTLMAFWALANSLFDVRQAKRLFGVLGAGGALASAAGGLAAPALVRAIGTLNLLWLASAGLLASVVVLRSITAHDLGPPPSPSAIAPRRVEPVRKLLADRYVVRIVAYVLCWWLTFYVLDNLFLGRVNARFSDADELASFLGVFFAIVGLAGLVVTLGVTGRLVGRFGVRAGLVTTPTFIVATLGAFVVVAVRVGPAAGAGLLVLASAARFTHLAVGLNLDQPTHGLLYKPFAVPRVGRVATLAEGIVQPLAIALAAGVLFVATRLVGLGPFGLGCVVAGSALAWLVASIVVSTEYPTALAAALARRQLVDARTPLVDQSSRALLAEACFDPRPAPALWAMIRLDELDPGEVDRLTGHLLTHPSPDVRRETLERLERRRRPVVGWTVGSEPIAEVAEAGLRTLLASADRTAQTLARSALADAPIALRRGAIVGLVRYGDDHERGEALSSLAALVCSPEADDRFGAAVVLGQLAQAAPISDVRALVADSECSVARAALESAAQLADADVDLTELWPSVVDAASQPDRAGAARTALQHAQGGADLPLLRQLDDDDPVRVQSALIALSQSDAVVDRDLVGGLVARELDTCDVLQVALDRLGAVDAVSLVAAALREELRSGLDHVALLVALGDRQARARVLTARPGLTQRVPNPMALEILETALPANFAARLMPMIEGDRVVPTPSGHEVQEQLQAIAAGHGQFRHRGWLRACAFDAARRLDAPWLVNDLATALASADPHPEVVAFAASVTRSERPNVLSTIELVLLLKGVDLFTDLPDRVLAQVAARLDQVDLAADEVVFTLGDSGDCLFVVAEGSVRVQTGDRLVNDLADGEVFGEMALLDPAPRSATVVAREPTRLARLDRESFLELVNEQPTVGIGVIRVLTGRLRARLDDIAQLDAELRARPSV